MSITLVIPLFAGLLFWFLPASLVWRSLEANKHLPYGTRMTLPRGTLHAGHSTIRFRDFPPSRFTWQLLGLTSVGTEFQLRYRLNFEGNHHAVSSTVGVHPSGLMLSRVSGLMDSKDINRLAAPFGHEFSGKLNIDLNDIALTSGCLESASGQVDWTGGSVRLNFFDQPRIYQLPSLTTEIAANDCGLKTTLQRDERNLGEFSLSNDGWFKARLQPEMLTLAKVPNADQVKQPLLFEEKIL